LIIIDWLTKFGYIILYKESNIVENLVYIFLRIVANIYKVSIEIISDRDKLFISILIDIYNFIRNQKKAFYNILFVDR
jgi:hypothetical protein